MVKIRLKKFGKLKQPYYRIVVEESSKPRDGVCIDEIGTYMPKVSDVTKQVTLDLQKAKDWLSKGAQPTDTVRKIISKESIKAQGAH